ncbi:MAG: hypothetical protein WAT19_10070 [Ferruginibacter sp.]
MKKILYTIAILLVSVIGANAQSQEGTKLFDNLQAKIDNSNLLIEWNAAEAEEGATWQVQASADGKEFITIGFVMGADPKAANSYKYKQGLAKIKPGLKYYRVLQLASNDTAIASNTISVAK